VARAGGSETRFEVCLLAKGLSTQSARRLMLIVRRFLEIIAIVVSKAKKIGDLQ